MFVILNYTITWSEMRATLNHMLLDILEPARWCRTLGQRFLKTAYPRSHDLRCRLRHLSVSMKLQSNGCFGPSPEVENKDKRNPIVSPQCPYCFLSRNYETTLYTRQWQLKCRRVLGWVLEWYEWCFKWPELFDPKRVLYVTTCDAISV